MKFNYLTLAVILIILFSIGSVAASENMTDDTSGSNDGEACLDDTSNDNQDILGKDDSSDVVGISKVDLSVKIDVESVYQGKSFNCEGFEVPWNITVKVTGGSAHNVRVQYTLSDNMELISADSNIGTHDSSKKIWDIGDLNPSDTAVLTVFTKLKSNGTFTTTATAQSGSFDTNSSNNKDSLYIKSGSDEDGSNTTETTDDSNKPDHNQHYLSTNNEGIVKREREGGSSNQNNGGSNKKSSKTNGKSTKGNSKTGSSSKSSTSKKSVKTTSSFSKSLSNSYKSINNVFDSKSNGEIDSNSKDTQSGDDFQIIPAYDYTRIPVLILAAVLVLLAVFVAYDKIKS